MKPFSTYLAAALFAISLMAGCVCAEPKTGADVAQIIVKFKDSTTPPSSAALLESLSKSAKLKVRYVRPMSGGAQIYVLSGSSDDAALADAMNQISARQDVEYAEIDQKLKPQKAGNNGVQQK
jgi:hypothetical protein